MVGLISALILIPLAGAVALYIGQPKNARTVALIFNALSAFYALMLWQKFDATAPGLQLVERHVWIPSIGAEYLVGVDGLSLLLVLLTSLVFPFAFSAQSRSAGERGACALMLVMQAALYGTFTAQNFVLWFLFYEMSLVPAFLLIKIYLCRAASRTRNNGTWRSFCSSRASTAIFATVSGSTNGTNEAICSATSLPFS